MVMYNAQPPQSAFSDPLTAQIVYGPSYMLAWQLYELQQLRDQTAGMRVGMLTEQASNIRTLAEMQAGMTTSLDAAKDMASQIIIGVQDAIAQQQRELEAMRARAQSPSLTNIALGPGAGRGITPATIPAPNIAGQLPGVPSLAALGSVPSVGGGGGSAPYTAWWTWSTGGPAPLGTGGGGMGSAAANPNPAAGLAAFGASAPASAPGVNAPAYLPALPPAGGASAS
jgi:hypothetical protein